PRTADRPGPRRPINGIARAKTSALRQCSPHDSIKQIYSYFHCTCSAQQALSIRLIGSTSRSVRRWITPPVTLVPRRVDLKRDHTQYLRLRIPRLTSTLARPNTLAGNGLHPRLKHVGSSRV